MDHARARLRRSRHLLRGFPLRLADLPPGISLWPEYAPIADQIEYKVTGVRLYASQLDRLFGGVRPMADAVRRQGRRVAELGGLTGGFAERYWTSVRV
jgi:hypothetical protein